MLAMCIFASIEIVHKKKWIVFGAVFEKLSMARRIIKQYK
jgi:hypothetical protein